MENCTQQKELVALLERMTQLGESRDKLIYEIDEILDRLKGDRKENKLSAEKCEGTHVDSSFVSMLSRHIDMIDLSNERLDNIRRRLNDLI